MPVAADQHACARVQGQLEVTTLKGTGAAADAEADIVERKPFFMLTLELPQARLFQDAVDKDIIPQVQPPPPLPFPPSTREAVAVPVLVCAARCSCGATHILAFLVSTVVAASGACMGGYAWTPDCTCRACTSPVPNVPVGSKTRAVLSLHCGTVSPIPAELWTGQGRRPPVRLTAVCTPDPMRQCVAPTVHAFRCATLPDRDNACAATAAAGVFTQEHCMKNHQVRV